MHSCLYEGRVRHRRNATGPDGVANAFEYRVFMAYLDLAELDRVFAGRWLWSARRPALAWLKRADHYGDPDRPLDACIRDLVAERTGRRPDGPVRLLTHLRYFGHCFNPVSFYYCFDASDTRVETIVAEVNNTPWKEQHCYVLPRSEATVRGAAQGFSMHKAFHVSPFLPMEQDYEWRFVEPDDRLIVHMKNIEEGRTRFDATLTLERREITGASLARALARFPLMTVRVVALIHWQALRLWIKGATFHTHPAKRRSRPDTTLEST